MSAAVSSRACRWPLDSDKDGFPGRGKAEHLSCDNKERLGKTLWTERTGKEMARTTLQAEQGALGAKVEAEYVHNKTGS